MGFSNCNDIHEAYLLNYNFSDHSPILLTRKKYKERYTGIRKQFTGRSYKNYNKAILQETLRDRDWTEFHYIRDVDRAWEIIINTITPVLDNMCPIKTHQIMDKGEPWLCNALLQQIRDKNEAWKLMKRTGTDEDKAISNRLRNKSKNSNTNARKRYISEKSLKEPKKFWEAMEEILPSKDKNLRMNIINEGKPVETDTCAEFVNTFFSSIGSKLADNFNDDWRYVGVTAETTMPDIHVSLEDVMEVIMKIDIKKSSAIDNISSRVLKDCFIAIPDKLQHLFNLSLVIGIFPAKWKEALVKPLPKGGDLSEVSNWRPVANIPLPGKLLEGIVHKNCSKYLEDNKLLNAQQGGFRKKTLNNINCSQPNRQNI